MPLLRPPGAPPPTFDLSVINVAFDLSSTTASGHQLILKPSTFPRVGSFFEPATIACEDAHVMGNGEDARPTATVVGRQYTFRLDLAKHKVTIEVCAAPKGAPPDAERQMCSTMRPQNQQELERALATIIADYQATLSPAA